MRRLSFVVLLSVLLSAGIALGAQAIMEDRSFYSQIFHEERNYRIFLPPNYEISGKRYPVIYWFHGWSERHNRPVQGGESYDAGTGYGGDTIAAFVASHDLIVAKWDGYNPRTPGENYLRPYNIGPVETDRQFPIFFPELVHYIDANYRTIADREHRGTSGLSMGGFMSFWIAGKYPDLVSSASNFMGSSEFVVGPRKVPVEYRHDEVHDNYDGLRTRLVMGSRDFIQFYHRRMNLIWDFTRERHESEIFDSEHGTPGMAKTLEFHMHAFANPLSKPNVWSHIDVYPEFSIWGWDVGTNRNRPGFTVIENVSSSGFRSSVRSWLPSGPLLSEVQVKITSPPLWDPGKKVLTTMIRLRDGAVRQLWQKADPRGRLSFQLNGDEYEVGIGQRPILALTGFSIDGAAWVANTEPMHVRARFINKGPRTSAPTGLRWDTSNPGIRLNSQTVSLPPLESGSFVDIPLTFTVQDDSREVVKLLAVAPGLRLPLEIPTFPPAAKTVDFKIVDGRSLPVYQQGTNIEEIALGAGNANGIANAGERVAILLPDDNAYRAAELFTNDACLDIGQRVSDNWSRYDHVGASAKYTLAFIRNDCPAGHLVRALARVQLPNKSNHMIRYAAVEFRVQ
jgi:hypothetical protein